MHTASKIASLSIAALISFSSEEKKSIEREENHYRSEHIELFTYHQGLLRGEVHARMTEKFYKVTGSLLQFRAIDRSTEFRITKIYVSDIVDFPHQVSRLRFISPRNPLSI